MAYTTRGGCVKEAFKKDLARGRKIEENILSLIQNKYPCAVLIDGSFKDYDLFIPETNKTVEIKGDFKSCETGNIIIELMMFGKPSALLSTKADYWIIYTGKEFLWTTPIKIKECIMVNNINSRELLGFGDSETKIACLIPINIFKRYCFRIDNEITGNEI